MSQRHEGLPQLSTRDPDIVLRHRQAAGIALLVAQTLEDPLRRVPLLRWRRPVGLEDRVNLRQKRPQLRLRHRLGSRVAGRKREPAHLRNRLPAQPEDPGRLTPAVALDKNEMPNGGVDFHGKHPGRPPKRNSLTTGRVLLQRGRSHRRRFMAYFVTALHSAKAAVSSISCSFCDRSMREKRTEFAVAEAVLTSASEQGGTPMDDSLAQAALEYHRHSTPGKISVTLYGGLAKR